VTYTAGAKLYNLGRIPAQTIYSISNSQLMTQDVFTGAAATPIVDGIVQLQAEYGRDTTMPTMDWTVDVWDTTTPANSDGWKRIVAVRLALVARSGLREKPEAGVCNATEAQPTWTGGTLTLTNDADGTSWRCYRYRTYETVVPLRNAIWRTL
jgi:type IV pilus assembly protein PilW